MKHSQHLRLFRQWDEQRQNRDIPARSAINIASLGPVLPSISLIEIDGEHFNYRLLGSEIIDDLGADYTGCRVGEKSSPHYAMEIINMLRRVRDERCAVFATATYRPRNKSIRRIARLFLPLTRGKANVEMIIVSRAVCIGGPISQLRHSDMISGVTETVELIADAEQLKGLCTDWENSIVDTSIKSRSGSPLHADYTRNVQWPSFGSFCR